MAIGNPISLTSNVEGKNISVIATADQTQFTVTGGYRINQITVFRNGVRLVDGRDYTAADASTVTLNSGAIVGDVIEFQVFDDFRVADALNVNNGGTVNGNVTVTGILSTTNLSIGSSIKLDSTSGIVTAKQFVGNVTGAITGTASTATNAEGLTGTPDITVNNIVASGATFSGVVTYEDVTNIDSLGIVTARTGVDITANGLVVNAGVTTLAADLSIADKIIHSGDTNTAIRFPSTDTVTVETAGVQRLAVDSTGDLGLVGIATATGLVVVAGSGVYAGHAGVVTAVTFDGALTGAVTGNSAGTHTGAVDLNGGVLTLDADADTTITADTDDQIDIAFGGNDRITLSTGLIDLKNDGSQSAIRLYCESSNAHYAALQAPAHSDFSGNTTLTLPATTDTLVARTTTDTLTNKTLTSPSISGPSITGDVSIADKIVHTGDTNTAIRFPSADTITAETAGVERFRIDSTGDVGLVGIATATGLVVVAGSGIYAGHTGIITAVTFDGALSGAATQVTVADESSDTTCFPLFATAATGDLAPKSGTNLTFNSSSGALTATSFVGALTGNVTGNISGGTVAGSTGTFTGDVDIADKIVHTGDTNTAIRFPAADTFSVETSGSERLRITSDGTILAGGQTSSMDGGFTNLELRKDASGEGGSLTLVNDESADATSTCSISVFQNYRNAGEIVFGRENANNWQSSAAGAASFIAFKTNSAGSHTERLRIKSDGTLHAIKTGTQITNADQTVAVFQRSSASGTTSKISIVSGNGAASHINFGDTDDEDIGQIIYDHSDNSMQFLTNTSGTLRIDSSGRLGLGTQSPNNALTINSATNAYMVQTRTNCSSIVGPAGTSASDGVLFGTTTNSPFIFYVNSSEKGRVDSSGRLLVDTTADRPIEQPFGNGLNSAQPGKLVIEDSGAGNLNLIVARENQSNAYGPAISLVKSRGTSDGSYTIVQAGDNLGTIQFGGADGSADRVGAAIVSQVDSTPGSDDMPGRLMFATTPDGSGHPIERLRITKDGHLSLVADDQKMIFGAGDDAEFTCDGTDFFLNLNSGINDFKIRDGTTLRFTFDDAGDFTATGNVTAYSDITLKDNIETIPNALDKVLNLRGVQFDRIDREDNPHEIGVIAQEVEEVIPEVVLTHEDGLKSVAYGNLVGLLIESIKELKAEVNDLKAQLEG